jgi:hypothetical protein
VLAPAEEHRQNPETKKTCEEHDTETEDRLYTEIRLISQRSDLDEPRATTDCG